MVQVKCKKCDDTEMVICPTCDGDGAVLAEIDRVESIVPCGKCNGDRDIECETCQS